MRSKSLFGSGLAGLGDLLGSAGRSHGAAARIDRPPAKAEFRAYIKAGLDLSTSHIFMLAMSGFEARGSTLAFPPLFAPDSPIRDP